MSLSKLAPVIDMEEGKDDICYRQIKDKYWYADYFGLQVVMDKSTEYINVNKLSIDGGKRFENWLANKHSKELVEFYESKLFPIDQSKSSGDDPKVCTDFGSNTLEFCHSGIPEWQNNQSKVLVRIYGGKGDEVIRGTYAHPKLVPHIASWVSNEFAYKVGCILDDLKTSFYKQKLEAQQFALEAAEAQRQALEEELEDKTILVDIVQQSAEC
jgi:KilA-N domain